jgi:hypothetical protein
MGIRQGSVATTSWKKLGKLDKRFLILLPPKATRMIQVLVPFGSCGSEIVLELKDFQSRNGGNSSVVGQKRAAVSNQRSRHLNRVRRLELEGCAELRRGFEKRSVNIDKTETSASRQ